MVWCAKCKTYTDMDQFDGEEGWKQLSKNLYLSKGLCEVCGAKVQCFTNEEGEYTKHTKEERTLARQKRHMRTIKKNALKIGLGVLNTNDPKNCVECVGECIQKCNTGIKKNTNTGKKRNIRINSNKK